MYIHEPLFITRRETIKIHILFSKISALAIRRRNRVAYTVRSQNNVRNRQDVNGSVAVDTETERFIRLYNVYIVLKGRRNYKLRKYVHEN